MDFPCVVYYADGAMVLVESDEALEELREGWETSPAVFGFVTAPSTDEQLLGTACDLSYASGAVHIDVQEDDPGLEEDASDVGPPFPAPSHPGRRRR